MEATTLEELVEEYGDAVYQRACLYLGDPSSADDVAQDVFVAALRHLPAIRNPKAWLAEATRNACRNHLRTRSRHAAAPLKGDLKDYGADPQERYEEGDVVGAVLGLPAELREVIVLSYYDGYRSREVAKLLRIPEGTVWSRLSRARKALLTLLQEGGRA